MVLGTWLRGKNAHSKHSLTYPSSVLRTHAKSHETLSSQHSSGEMRDINRRITGKIVGQLSWSSRNRQRNRRNLTSTRWKERMNSLKQSSELHTHALGQMYLHIQTVPNAHFFKIKTCCIKTSTNDQNLLGSPYMSVKKQYNQKCKSQFSEIIQCVEME